MEIKKENKFDKVLNLANIGCYGQATQVLENNMALFDSKIPGYEIKVKSLFPDTDARGLTENEIGVAKLTEKGEVTLAIIKKAVLQLNKASAPGSDGIPARLIQHIVSTDPE